MLINCKLKLVGLYKEGRSNQEGASSLFWQNIDVFFINFDSYHFYFINSEQRCTKWMVFWLGKIQFCGLSNQVSPGSHQLTAVGLVRDVIQTRLKIQLEILIRFSLDIRLRFIWYLGQIASGPKVLRDSLVIKWRGWINLSSLLSTPGLANWFWCWGGENWELSVESVENFHQIIKEKNQKKYIYDLWPFSDLRICGNDQSFLHPINAVP